MGSILERKVNTMWGLGMFARRVDKFQKVNRSTYLILLPSIYVL